MSHKQVMSPLSLWPRVDFPSKTRCVDSVYGVRASTNVADVDMEMKIHVHTCTNHLWCPRTLRCAHTRSSLTNSICLTRMTVFLSRCSVTDFLFIISFYNYLTIITVCFPSFVVIFPSHRNLNGTPTDIIFGPQSLDLLRYPVGESAYRSCRSRLCP